MKKLIPKFIGLWFNVLALVAPRRSGKAIFTLFCTPRALPLKKYQLDFFKTAETSSFELDGLKIQTYRWGNGPRRILFLHGWQSHTFRWKKYIEQFSKEEFTVYALDAPAHGLTGGKTITLPLYSRVIEQYISILGPVDAVVSHSFGGFAVLHAFYQTPSLPVKRLVLMGVPGESADFIRQLQRVLGITTRTIRAALDYFVLVIQQTPEFFSSERFAKGISIPVLIIHNSPDDEAPYHYAERLHRTIPGSVLMTTTGLGHNLKSETVVNAVLDFVREGELVASTGRD